MVTSLRIFVALALAACLPSASADRAAVTDADARAAWYHAQAAMLGPACWHLAATTTAHLDVTVPPSSTWWSTNYLQIDVNAPLISSTDVGTEGDRRHLAHRHLDVRDAVALPGGTRIRNNLLQNTAYVWYCDPDDEPAADEALYWRRIARVATLPLHEAEIERGGGGSIDEDLRLTLPGAGPILVVAGDVFEDAWGTVGWIDARGTPLNWFDELSANAGSTRFGGELLQPIPRGTGLEMACRRGTWSGNPDPGTAYPGSGSCTIVWAELPGDW